MYNRVIKVLCTTILFLKGTRVPKRNDRRTALFTAKSISVIIIVGIQENLRLNDLHNKKGCVLDSCGSPVGTKLSSVLF